MVEIKDLVVPWFHEKKIRLEVVYIRNEGNLSDTPSRQRDLDMWCLHQPTQQEFLLVTLVTDVSLISREPNLRFERISISRGFL